MTETVHFSRILHEDMDLGDGTRSIRLADGGLHTLNRINIGTLSIPSTVPVAATAGSLELPATFPNPAGARVHGVTLKVTTALGNGNGLTGFDVGDADLMARWGTNIAITLNTETTSNDFQSADEPIVAASYVVLLTPYGGTFDGTGEIEVQLHWSILRHL